MTPHVLVGVALIVVGLADCALALFIVGPRIADPRGRRMIQATLLGGGALLIVVGAVSAAGVGAFFVG